MRNRHNQEHGSKRWIRFFFGSPVKMVFWGGLGIFLATLPWLVFLTLVYPGFIQATLENLRTELQPLFALAIQCGVIVIGLYFLLKAVRPKKKR